MTEHWCEACVDFAALKAELEQARMDVKVAEESRDRWKAAYRKTLAK